MGAYFLTSPYGAAVGCGVLPGSTVAIGVSAGALVGAGVPGGSLGVTSGVGVGGGRKVTVTLGGSPTNEIPSGRAKVGTIA